MRAEVLGAERRRRWSAAEKRQIVEESLDPVVKASGIARRHGISRSLLVSCRRQFLKHAPEASGGQLLPVEVTPHLRASDQEHGGTDRHPARLGEPV